jgi:predicted dehydrogenase
MTDWGAHHFDIIHWAMNVEAPLTAACAGGKYCLEDNSETPDAFAMDLEYPGFTARYTVRYTNGRVLEGRPYGIAFYGTKGTLVVDRGSWEVIPETAPRPSDIDRVRESLGIQLSSMPGGRPAAAPPRPRPEAPRPAPALLCEPLKQTGLHIDPACQEAHVQNWLDSIRSRKTPAADVETGHRVITACHLGAIAYRVGRKVRWDAKNEAIIADPEAQNLTTKTYRAPWVLPRV